MTNDPRLWEYRWVRDFFLVLLLVTVTVAAYYIRAVTLPILIGLALAYAFHPLVTWAERALTMPRWLSTLLLQLIVLTVIASMLLYIMPQLVRQSVELARKTPGYVQYVAKRSGVDWQAWGLPAATSQPAASQAAMQETATTQPSTQPTGSPMAALAGTDLTKVAGVVFSSLGIGLDLVGSTLSVVIYTIVGLAVVLVCSFYFLWKFDHIMAWFKQFIPPDNRKRVLEVAGMMDQAVSAFFRGRMIQAVLVGLELTIGWCLVGVPYWLLLGLVGGVLHLIPYGAAVAWPVAVALAWINAATGSGFEVWHVLVWPSVVYFVAQGLDGWAVEPLVQAKATDLDPLSVMLAVLIGGALAGLFGMLVAVPVAACGKILAREVFLPRLVKKHR